MTVTTEAVVTIPAYLVGPGDYVWCESTQAWERVLHVRDVGVRNGTWTLHFTLDDNLTIHADLVVSAFRDLRVVSTDYADISN